MKCPKCGLEFEGKFCPECGTPAEPAQQKCPSCGRIRQDGEKFCSACGYSWEENALQTEPPKEPENKLAKVCLILPRVPAFAFALFSVLVFIFFCAPVVNIFGIGYGSVYSRSEDLPSLDGSLITLIILAVIGILVAAAAVTAGFLPQFKYKKFTAAGKTFSLDIVIAAVCCLILLIYFIIGCVICGIISAEGEGTGLLTAGAAPILIIVFSLLFLIVCGGAPVALMLIYKKNPALKAEAEQVAAEQTAKLNGGASGAGAAVQAGAVKQNKAAVFIKSHKKLTAIIALALVVVIALGVTLGILLGGKDDEDIFSINKVSDIEIGGTQNSVANALGDPYEYTDSEWVYYSSEYADILDELTEVTEQYKYTDSWSERASLLDQQMELYEKLETTIYKTITIYFESTESDTGEIVYTVSSIYFDADCCDSYAYAEKTLENVTILSGEVAQYSSSAEITYEAKFTDGSYIKNSVTATPTTYAGYIAESIGSKTELTWSDNWHSGYTTTMEVTDSIAYELVGTVLYVYQEEITASTFTDIDETSVTSIVIADSVASIGSNSFNGYTSLINVTIGKNVESIGSSAFYNCDKLIEIYNLSSLDITMESTNNGYVGYYAKNIYTSESGSSNLITQDNFIFYNDDGTYYLMGYTGNNTTLTLPTTVNGKTVSYSIYEYAFYYNTKITSINISDSVTSIGSYAFDGCTALTSITIPDNVTSIDDYAFYNCTALTSITIPDNVTSIGDCAFYNCASLESVTIGNSVETIIYSAFYNCTSLESITVNSGNTYYKSVDGNLYSYDGTKLIQYAKGKTDTSFTIPDSVTSIGSYAFDGCTALTSVTIGDSVTTISDYAFMNSKSLTSITIGASVTSIGNSAFENCTSLTSITIPDNVTSIGDFAFYNCTSLTSITIPDSMTSIGKYTFYNCTSLTSITIPDNVTSIGDYAFRGCSSLTSITIPDKVTYIGSYAFYGCTSLESIIFENTSGWWVSTSSTVIRGISVGVTDASENVTYLTRTYYDFFWLRSES